MISLPLFGVVFAEVLLSKKTLYVQNGNFEHSHTQDHEQFKGHPTSSKPDNFLRTPITRTVQNIYGKSMHETNKFALQDRTNVQEIVQEQGITT